MIFAKVKHTKGVYMESNTHSIYTFSSPGSFGNFVLCRKFEENKSILSIFHNLVEIFLNFHNFCFEREISYKI